MILLLYLYFMIFKTEITDYTGSVFHGAGEYVINTSCLVGYAVSGSTSKLLYTDRWRDRRTSPIPAYSSSTVAEIQAAVDSPLDSNIMTLSVFPGDDTSLPTVAKYIKYSDFVYAKAYRKNTAYSLVSFIDGGMMARVVVDNTLDEIIESATPVGAVATITTPTIGTFSFNMAGVGDVTINWGDGSIERETLGLLSSYSHSYTGGGVVSISGAENITEIELGRFNDVTEIDIPETAINIKSIYLGHPDISSFTTYKEWVNLEKLLIPGASLSSLETHKEWVNLVELEISSETLLSLETHSEWINLDRIVIISELITAINLHPEWVNISTIYVLGIMLSSAEAHSSWVGITTYNLSGGAIVSETDINNILIALDDSAMSSGEISLDEGTNAAPTGAGITAANNLSGRGVTVSTN